MVFIVGTFIDIPGATNEDGSQRSHFVVMGTYPSKSEAKAAIEGLAPSVFSGQYETLSIYELHPEENKVYTFHKKELKDAFTKFQEQQAPPSFFPSPQVNILNTHQQDAIPIVLDSTDAKIPGQV